MIHGSFFWGYIITQIPGGFICQKFAANRSVNSLFVLHTWCLCILASTLSVSLRLSSLLLQGVWLCDSGHVVPKHAHPCCGTHALRLCYPCQNMPRACGGASPCSRLIDTRRIGKRNTSIFANTFSWCIFSPNPPPRVFPIQPVTAFGPNGRHLLKEVAWPQPPSAVSPLPLRKRSLSH